MLLHISIYHIKYQYMKHPLRTYTHPFPPCLCFYRAIKISPNWIILNTHFVCWTLFLPPTITTGFPLLNLHQPLHIIIFIFPSCKIIQLADILKHCKKGYPLLCRTHNPHMNQHMKSYGQKMTYFWQQVHQNTPWIYLGTPNMNPNINLSLLNLPPVSPEISFVISFQNPYKRSLVWFWLNSLNVPLVLNSYNNIVNMKFL